MDTFQVHPFLGNPAWLDLFLAKETFFDDCSVHDFSKYYKNRYCINCDLALCQQCITSGSHEGHNILKIYRLVYKNVVREDEMENYMDCTKIQVCDRNNGK